MNLPDDVKVQVAKVAPAVPGAVYGLSSLPWSNIAAAVTVLYVALQIAFLIRDKWWRDPGRKLFRRRKARR